MISTNYLHEYAPFDQFMYESYYLLLDMKDAENQLIALESTIQEKIFFGERVDGETLVLESEKQNIFARIGEAVISLFESFVDFLKKVGNTIKESVGNIRKKTSSDKIKEAMNKNPELADQFLQGVMSGKVNAHTVKDLDELLDEATKISNELATGKIDKKDHAKKIDEALEKFGNRARNIASIVGLVGAVGGAVQAIDKLASRKSDKEKEKQEWEWKQKNQKAKEKEKSKFYASASDIVDGDYVSESVNPINAIKKVVDYFSDYLGFCDKTVSKVNKTKEDLVRKVQSSQNADDASNVSAITSGFNKVLSAISKDVNTVKNASKSLEAKLA
jgi:hypothetical protein